VSCGDQKVDGRTILNYNLFIYDAPTSSDVGMSNVMSLWKATRSRNWFQSFTIHCDRCLVYSAASGPDETRP
jgi:hypothetical protein